MKQIQISFQNNKFLCDLSKSNNDIHLEIEKQLKKRYGLQKNTYYITTNNKLVSKDWDFYQNEEKIYQIHIRINGGFVKALFRIASSILDMAMLALKIPLFIFWLIELIVWIVIEVLNPLIFFQDLTKSIFAVIKFLMLTIFDFITGSVKYFVNMIAAPIISGFWGYTPSREKNTYAIIFNGVKTNDFIVVKKSKESFDNIFKKDERVIIQSNKDDSYQLVNIVSTSVDSGTEKYGKTKVKLSEPLTGYYSSGSILAKPTKYGKGKTQNKCNKKKCIQFINPNTKISGSGLGLNIDLGKPPNGTPLAVILTTILLPPLGLFMEIGMKGWINIILCAIFTFMYYFPGLLYALIIIYC
jgi:uncharacterized membrane protein YqaE (UPF0057 family)